MSVTVDITSEDITYAETFLAQYLSDKMPTADFSAGTGLRDLAVKAMAYNFAYLRSEVAKVKKLRSLAQLKELAQDDETIEAVDDINSNFYIKRGTGSNATVVATVALSQKVDVYVPITAVFNRDGTYIFYPKAATYVYKEDLTETIKTDGTTVYEFDIALEAEAVGTGYNILAGNFISWDSFSPYIVSIRNDSVASGGAEIETNVEFISRGSDAITVRNLVNPKSIKTVLMDEFSGYGLSDVVVVGYGDDEMLRDIINTNVTWTTIDLVHIGNHQDIYVALPLLEDQVFTSTTYTESYLGEPDRSGAIRLPQVPILKISRVYNTDTEEELTYSLFVRDSNLYYTTDQEAYIVTTNGIDNIPVTIIYDTVSNFSLIDTYLKDADERISLANNLAKSKIPVYITLNIPYYQITGKEDLDTAAATSTLISYINNLTSADTLYVDSIVKLLHDNYGSQIVVKSPFLLQGTIYYPDGTNKIFYTENKLVIPDYLALGVTTRVCMFLTSASYITFTEAS